MTHRRITLIVGAVATAALFATTTAFAREAGPGTSFRPESAHQVATQADDLVDSTDDVAWEERHASDASGWAVRQSPQGLFSYRVPPGWTSTDTASHTGDGGPRVAVELNPSDIPAVSEGATASGFVQIEISMQPFDVPAESGDAPLIKDVTLQRSTVAKLGQATAIQLKQFGPHPQFPNNHGVLVLSVRIAGEGGMTLNAFAAVHFPLDLTDVDDVLAALESIQVAPAGTSPAPPATGSGAQPDGVATLPFAIVALAASFALAALSRRRWSN